MIEEFVRLVPESLLNKPGDVFYSGRRAFGSPSHLYILGANPGGFHQRPIVAEQIHDVLYCKPEDWSAYKDDGWGRFTPGKHFLQQRMLRLLNRLALEPSDVPASEVVFLRSRSLGELSGDFRQLAAECWPFHRAIIESLQVRVVVCLGKLAGEWVRNQLGAHTLVDEFTDTKPGFTRGWKSYAYRNAGGLTVVRLSHPSRAIWTDPASDPTVLVERALSS